MSDDKLQDIGDEDDLDQFDEGFEGGGTSLSELWKHSPLVKIGVVVAGFVVLVGGLILFGGEGVQTRTSLSTGGSNVKDVVGTEEVSPEIAKQFEEFNITEVEKAMQEGGSALPVPITPARGGVPLRGEDVDADDPLERWRRIQEERQKRETQETPNLPEVDPNAEAVDALAQAMLSQMEKLLGSIQVYSPNFVEVTSADYLEEQRLDDDSGGGPEDDVVGEDAEPVQIILPAGTIEYAQLLLEANSDSPGPVLAQVVSGPLAGSRMLGSFQEEDEFLIIDFNVIVIDGISHGIDAVAINPDTATPGLVTEYDGRYFKRVVLPAAAEFIEGFAEAVSETNSTVVVTGDVAVEEEEKLDTRQELLAGAENAAESIAEFLEDEASTTKPLIRVAAGTPVGILFLEPVTEEDQ